jgi:phosphoribosylformylglycinamidine synthase subunit PurQ / glutaminase
MKRQDIRVGVLRIEGTNSEEESARCFRRLGAQAELVHLKQLLKLDTWPGEERKLSDYHILFFPGGFSAGDYVRAGAIFAARLKVGLGKELADYVATGRLAIGICNGFQILTEVGLLPNLSPGPMAASPEACLFTNDSAHYECRPVLVKHVNRGKNAFTKLIPNGEVRTIQSAHGEGKLLVDRKEETRILKELEDNDQIVFRYVDAEGAYAGYPWNPSGAPGNIAGVCNRDGNVFGMMPHPERVFYRHTHPDWTRTGLNVRGDDVGDGRAVFESALQHVEKKF